MWSILLCLQKPLLVGTAGEVAEVADLADKELIQADDGVPAVDSNVVDCHSDLTAQNLLVKAFMSRGYTEDIANVMLAARTEGSHRQYKVYYQKYLEFASLHGFNPLSGEEDDLP